MAYRLAGTYVGHCDCQLICPCAMDGPPTGRDGQCHGLLVFRVEDGNLDDTDLFWTDSSFVSNNDNKAWTIAENQAIFAGSWGTAFKTVCVTDPSA